MCSHLKPQNNYAVIRWFASLAPKKTDEMDISDVYISSPFRLHSDLMKKKLTDIVPIGKN